MSKTMKNRVWLPECEKRKFVNGMYMCQAIGCCEIGDMPCECPCNRPFCNKIHCDKNFHGNKP